MQNIKGTTFIVLLLVLIHLQLASGAGFLPNRFPVVKSPAYTASSKVLGGQPNLQKSNTTLATSQGNTMVEKFTGVKDQIMAGFQATLDKLNKATTSESEKETFLMNAIFQPGKNLTTADIGDFLQVFSQLDEDSIETIMDANDNFKNLREQYAKMDSTGKKKTVSGLLRFLDRESDFGLNKAEVYSEMMDSLGDMGFLFTKRLPPMSRKQQQQATKVFGKLQQQTKNGDSPYYFKSILQNLQTFVSNIQKFLEIFDADEMKTDMSQQKQKVMGQRLQLNQLKQSLKNQGLGNFIGMNVTDIQNNFDKRFPNNTSGTDQQARFRQNPTMFQEFPVGQFPVSYKPLYNQSIPRNQTPSLNTTKLDSLQKYFKQNQKLQKSNKAYLRQYAQTKFIGERRDSPVLDDLRGNMTGIQNLASAVAKLDYPNSPREIMKIIFNKDHKGVIGYLTGLCNAIGERGTQLQNKFLLQKDIDFGDKRNLATFFNIMKLAKYNSLYDQHQPIFFNTLPAGSFVDTFQKILEKFNVSEETRNELHYGITKFATQLEQQYKIILENIRMMTVECYKVSRLKKYLIYLKDLKENLPLSGPEDITQEQGEQTVKQFKKRLKAMQAKHEAEHDTLMKKVQAEYDTRMKEVYKLGEKIVNNLSGTIKLVQDGEKLLTKDSKEKTNISNAIQQMALTFFTALHSVSLAKAMFPPVAKFLNSSLNFIQNRVNEMFLPRGKQQHFYLAGPGKTTDVQYQVQEGPGKTTDVQFQEVDDDVTRKTKQILNTLYQG